MPSLLDRPLMTLSLRQIGQLLELEVEASAEDREGFEKFFDVPLRVLAREFRGDRAARRYVLRKLELAAERRQAKRIASIF